MLSICAWCADMCSCLRVGSAGATQGDRNLAVKLFRILVICDEDSEVDRAAEMSAPLPLTTLFHPKVAPCLCGAVPPALLCSRPCPLGAHTCVCVCLVC